MVGSPTDFTRLSTKANLFPIVPRRGLLSDTDRKMLGKILNWLSPLGMNCTHQSISDRVRLSSGKWFLTQKIAWIGLREKERSLFYVLGPSRYWKDGPCVHRRQSLPLVKRQGSASSGWRRVHLFEIQWPWTGTKQSSREHPKTTHQSLQCTRPGGSTYLRASSSANHPPSLEFILLL